MPGALRGLDSLPSGELRGKRALVRVDYNVPLDGEGRITDPSRIEASIPTLRKLLDAGAATYLVSHLGRPKEGRTPEFSLRPVADWLGTRLKRGVHLFATLPGETGFEEEARDLPAGGVALLENIRFSPGETKNDPELARALAGLADLFVGDAFGVAHRAHASNVGAAELLLSRGGAAVAGHLMEREVEFLESRLADPARPFTAVMGGAKISGKIDAIEAILPRVDHLLIGGAMANTFFRALGLETGDSLVEEDRIELARDLLERGGERIVLPLDCVVGQEIAAGARARVRDRTEVAAGEKIGDIGPRSRALFERRLAASSTILWNGPMGVFELPAFEQGTFDLAHSMAEAADRGALVIVGGGDSAAAAVAAGVAERVSHISTGGGASIELLAGRPLPGVDILRASDEGGAR